MSDDKIIPIHELPEKKVEEDDPLERIGVELSGQSEGELRDLALCFAEEFIRDGWDEMELFYIFQNPFYAGPHLVWKQKGDDFVKGVIAEAVSMWRPKILSLAKSSTMIDDRSSTVDQGA